MKILIYIAVIFQINIIWIMAAYPQVPALNDNTAAIQNEIIKSQQRLPREKIYLHTDRTLYLSGEHIWLKAYCLNADDPGLPPVSRVVYIDLINPEGQNIALLKLKTLNKTASGDIYLHDSLPTGSYILRAYSNWMKNFDQAHFYSKHIFVINRFADKLIQGRTNEGFPQMTCKFYPEGGQILQAQSSRIAYKLVSTEGKGLNLRGWIEDNSGDRIADLQSIHGGIGSFELLPVEGKSFSAVFEIAGKQYRYPIPEASNSGYSIKTNESSGQEELGIEITKSGRALSAKDKVYLILLPARSKSVVYERNLINGRLNEKIKENLPEGIVQIILLDEHENQVCERLIYHHAQYAAKITCSGLKKSYGFREKVQIQIELADVNGKLLPLELSVAVTNVTMEINSSLKSSDIYSQMFLQSDIQESIEDPSWYFESMDPARIKALDNLMITLQGQAANWGEVSDKSNPVIKYCAEQDGIRLSGRISDNSTHAGVVGQELILASPDTVPEIKYAVSENDGRFLFILDKFYGSRQMVIQPASPSASGNISLTIESPFASLIKHHDLSMPEADSLLNAYILKALQRTRINKTYLINPAGETHPIALPRPLKCYGNPDRIIFPDDYIKLPNLEEIIVELVPGVKLKKRNDEYFFQVMNYEQRDINKLYTLLVDGIPVKNPQSLLSWDSDKIKKIEVCYNSRVYGDFLMGGVVSVFSKTGNCPIEIPGILYRRTWEGFHVPRNFIAPEYRNPESRSDPLPDFRNVLYWNPSVSSGISGTTAIEFFTSDESGPYSLVIEGFTSDGFPVRTELPFRVEKMKSEDR